MKKFILTLLLLGSYLIAQENPFPAKLEGLWEGKDRYVFFETRDYEKTQMVIILKEYYGWYLDRAVEPDEYAKIEERRRNIATVKKSEHVNISYEEICADESDFAWNIILDYSKNDHSFIPLALIDNKIYLEYYLKKNEKINQDEISSKNGFWMGSQVSEGITISKQNVPDEIKSYYVDSDKIFSIRYWLANIDYQDEIVSFKYDGESYSILKNINSLNSIYTCIKGRGKKLRNLDIPKAFNEEKYVFSKNNKIMAVNEPYLLLVANKNELSDVITLINEHNSLRKPSPPSLFPDSNVDWHWDLINELEKDNLIIQEVRKRQNQFGPRNNN
jgi:hypothetical protein